jgi:hypothetical protein
MTDDPVAFVLAAFRGHGRSRSKLYWWMAEHYDQLARAKQAGRRVDWISVTAEMTAMGFKAAGKAPLKPETVRRTWYRVDADHKRSAVDLSSATPAPTLKPAANPQPSTTGRNVAATRSIPPLPSVDAGEDQDAPPDFSGYLKG